MCGISGRVNFNNENVDEKSLILSIEKLKSRGPDNRGIWIEGGCGLAHSRLSIIDLTETGNQPMTSMDGRFVCVFNGEIYNYEEIRKQIGSQFHWRSTSDTEVLLEAWSKWGKDCLLKLDGMFAFVIWDKHENKIFSARDRIGEKPFYYHWNGKSFSFASRPSALFILDKSISKDFDNQALRYFLECGYIPAPLSAHKDIKKLEPSSILEADENGLKVHKYWDHSNFETEENWKHRKEDDLLDELDEIISKSVLDRMVSDVPLGAFLSGGIDSSLIVAMMAKHSSTEIKTFTIGFEERDYDESSHAQAVAESIGTDHYSEILGVNQLLDLMPNFLANYDEPFFDSSAFPSMAVSKLAKKQVTVSLSGDGGDELFGGYHYYKIAKYLNPFFKTPETLRRLSSYIVGKVPLHQAKLVSSALAQNESSRSFAFTRSIAKDFHQVLNEAILEETNSMLDLFANKASSFPQNLHSSEEGMRLDLTYTLNDDYLQKTDVATMAFSLESRAPLLSNDVIEWAIKLPVKWKIKGNTNKYLLRKLLYRYVPRNVVDRPKRGFGVPIDSWLRNELYSWSLERLDNDDLYTNLPLKKQSVIDLFTLHQSGRRDVHPLLWAILMLLEFNNSK